jgi:uncharacterized protein (TIGR03067 family)
MRSLALLLAATVCLAFAPAPFPKPDRRETGADDLTRLQGTWVRMLHNGQAQPGNDVVVVRGDVWRYNTPNDSWVMKFDTSKKPKHIDLIRVGEKANYFRGIYRLEGDTFTYSLRHYGSEQQRPMDYDTSRAYSWVSVYKRQKP